MDPLKYLIKDRAQKLVKKIAGREVRFALARTIFCEWGVSERNVEN